MGQSADQLRREIEDTRGDLGETLEAIGDRVSPGRMIERRKNRMMLSLRTVRERVMGKASETGRAMGDTAGGAIDTLTSAPDTVREQTQGSPLMAGAIAFGVGVITASIVKPSEFEREAAEQLIDKVEPVKQELKDAGQEMAEHLKEPLREAVDQVKETAAGGAQAMTDAAKDIAQTGQQTVREAADAVRSEATGRPSNRSA